MNPLKALLNKVFDTAPPVEEADASKQDAAFEWNPDEETVAPTSARSTSWRRDDAPDEAPRPSPGEATNAEIAASAQNLPRPTFEKSPPPSPLAASVSPSPSLSRTEPPPVPAPLLAPPPAKAVALEAAAPVSKTPSQEEWVKPSVTEAPMAARAATPAPIPLSDFEDVYRKAGIKSPVHGYGVERVYRLLTSRRLVGLDRSVKRSALLTALDAAGVPPSDVSQDAVLRRKALTAYEAEKALELQSLRSRNESRAEALQDTVETFTRQKQSQIERLAQGSTSAVRAQSDLEIRKRMEQDRLYRSLAYFVEPLPLVTREVRPLPEPPKVIERFDATIEMPAQEVAPAAAAAPAPAAPVTPPVEPPQPSPVAAADQTLAMAAPPRQGAGTSDAGAGDTLPLSQSGLEMALKAAAEEARKAGWGQTAIVEDASGDTVEALRKLREPKKTESES